MTERMISMSEEEAKRLLEIASFYVISEAKKNMLRSLATRYDNAPEQEGRSQLDEALAERCPSCNQPPGKIPQPMLDVHHAAHGTCDHLWHIVQEVKHTPEKLQRFYALVEALTVPDEGIVETAEENAPEQEGFVRKVRADGLGQSIRDCCSECHEIAWESCFIRGQCRRYVRPDEGSRIVGTATPPPDPLREALEEIAAHDCSGVGSPPSCACRTCVARQALQASGSARDTEADISRPTIEEGLREALERILRAGDEAHLEIPYDAETLSAIALAALQASEAPQEGEG